MENKSLRGGRYTLLRKLGEGSQGETYEASATTGAVSSDLAGDFGRYVAQARAGVTPKAVSAHVAIKAFRVSQAKEWKDVELAEREARTLASLDHPLLPKYIEHFEEDGALYLVMEKVEGVNVASLRTLDVNEVIRMIEDVGNALRYLHGRAPTIVHRDIKPSNVIRRPDGSFALVDFGAVRDRLKPQGGSTVVGTFGFMAPEQFQGRASPRSDLYGLGATALTLLTGEQPENLPHRGLGIDVAHAVPSGTPRALVDALKAMLAPNPEERAPSIDAVLGRLRHKASAPPPKAREKNLTRKQRRTLRRAERDAQRHLEREMWRRRHLLARPRRVPLVPLVFAKLGLFMALIAVTFAVGIFVPLFLNLLSLVFGKALRRGAAASWQASRRAQGALGRASQWLSGHRAGDAAEVEAQVRVGTEVRIAPLEEPLEEELESELAPEPRQKRRHS